LNQTVTVLSLTWHYKEATEQLKAHWVTSHRDVTFRIVKNNSGAYVGESYLTKAYDKTLATIKDTRGIVVTKSIQKGMMLFVDYHLERLVADTRKRMS